MLALQRQFTAALVLLVLSFVARAAESEQPSARELIRRGSDQLIANKIDAAIKSFEKAVSIDPKVKAHLWQLGIAYYYAGRFTDGRDLFALHQTVNSHDVENAVWHFLCVARAEGIDVARKKLIPISGDPRVPMKQVHSLFAGTGAEEDVLKAASAVGDESNRKNALCYAHLYIGLYHEALGNSEKALEHLRKAQSAYAQPHYMGRIARLHFQLQSVKNQ
jgi:lipoprotein NlpI